MGDVADAASAVLVLLGVATMVIALWRNLARGPATWSWHKALFHPNYWVEPYGRHYRRGVLVLLAGLAVGLAG
jgi:hypothetical protein